MTVNHRQRIWQAIKVGRTMQRMRVSDGIQLETKSGKGETGHGMKSKSRGDR